MHPDIQSGLTLHIFLEISCMCYTQLQQYADEAQTSAKL